MMSGQVQDVLNRFEEAMKKIDDIEKTFETKFDNKFNELLVRLSQPPPAAPVAPLQQQQQQQHLQRRLPNQVGLAQRVPIELGQNSGAAAPTVDASLAPATAVAKEDDDYAGDYEDEVDQNQNYVQPPAPPPAGRPQVYIRNGRPAPPPQVVMTIFLN